MIKIENTEVMGWEAAIRGMRNPMNSWRKSDSGYCQQDLLRDCRTCVHKDTGYDACFSHFDIGPNDHDLMTRLAKAGTDHRKFMRMIAVHCDITAPLYWWKEFDTYKVGTVANSCSTMHKIADKEFTLEDFSYEHLETRRDCKMYAPRVYAPRVYKFSTRDLLELEIQVLNQYRQYYLETKAKQDWWQMIQLLPSSYNQRRTVMLNYEVLANIYKSREGHKLDEWNSFCDWIESLPYAELITGKEK